MKKALSLGMIVTLLVVLHPSQKIIATQQLPPQPQTSPQTTKEQQAKKGFIYYTWYYDQDATVPVGTESTVTTEMSRLRALYSYYTFSATPAWGLHEFEYGYYIYYSAIIYSDCPFTPMGLNSRDSASRLH